MLLGHTSAMLRSGGSGRRQRRAITLASAAARDFASFGSASGSPRLFEERAPPPVLLAQSAEQLRHRCGREQIDRDRLADAIHGTGRARRDRARIGGHIGRDEEDLILVDVAIHARRQHRAHRRPAGVDGEVPRARNAHAAQRRQTLAQRDGAAYAAGQRLLEIEHEALLVDPAALSRGWGNRWWPQASRADRRAGPSDRKSGG
jgi:hypothetical protein